MQNILHTWHLRHSPTGTPVGGAASSTAAGGLDPLIVQSFPTFLYSTVKDYRKEKYGLECAICLVEFDASDVLRLLTTCCHVFHQECIDLWLESHKTCPVCRRNLDSPVQSPVKSPIYASNVMHEMNENALTEDSFSITIKDENEGERRGGDDKDQSVSSSTGEQGDEAENKVEKYSRSHSTGHSIITDSDEEDRFTLRLPEHVKSDIVRSHKSNKSWTTFGEYNAKANTRNFGLTEVSELSGGDINKV
ncbi:RING-H2 finger protein ATL29 [Sesamum alatum]|uniref:RING-type E3 ubiquitin transferase n=1 Tax=Sesamum alatum TaxID=300844 RepID=A0AAE1Y3Z7_9LAMI|nr:RING-H2 finger protein ATL29 [Sesamum alatum]